MALYRFRFCKFLTFFCLISSNKWFNLAIKYICGTEARTSTATEIRPSDALRLAAGRFVGLIYICFFRSCLKPVHFYLDRIFHINK